jgi:hypothetical protein
MTNIKISAKAYLGLLRRPCHQVDVQIEDKTVTAFIRLIRQAVASPHFALFEPDERHHIICRVR